MQLICQHCPLEIRADDFQIEISTSCPTIEEFSRGVRFIDTLSEITGEYRNETNPSIGNSDDIDAWIRNDTQLPTLQCSSNYHLRSEPHDTQDTPLTRGRNLGFEIPMPYLSCDRRPISSLACTMVPLQLLPDLENRPASSMACVSGNALADHLVGGTGSCIGNVELRISKLPSPRMTEEHADEDIGIFLAPTANVVHERTRGESLRDVSLDYHAQHTNAFANSDNVAYNNRSESVPYDRYAESSSNLRPEIYANIFDDSLDECSAERKSSYFALDQPFVEATPKLRTASFVDSGTEPCSEGNSPDTPTRTPADSFATYSSLSSTSTSGRGNSSSGVFSDSDVTSTAQRDHKPAKSFIALIGEAILSSPERQMVLSEIYDYVLRMFPYYRNSKCAWRNSIRHNLSVNECFRKSRAAKTGRGYYWALHDACVADFRRGEFNRRQARARVQRATRGYAPYERSPIWPLDHLPSFPRPQSYVPMTSTPARGYCMPSKRNS